MTANEIKQKYGIGSSHLYRIWLEATREQELEREAEKQAESKQSETDALLHQMKQRLGELENVQHSQNLLETRSLPEMHKGWEWLSEYNHRLLFNINKKVDDMADKLQTIHAYVENANAVLDLAQDEVEIIASDVKDIDEKVDDVKSVALPKLSDVAAAVDTVERV